VHDPGKPAIGQPGSKCSGLSRATLRQSWVTAVCPGCFAVTDEIQLGASHRFTISSQKARSASGAPASGFVLDPSASVDGDLPPI